MISQAMKRGLLVWVGMGLYWLPLAWRADFLSVEGRLKQDFCKVETIGSKASPHPDEPLTLLLAFAPDQLRLSADAHQDGGTTSLQRGQDCIGL